MEGTEPEKVAKLKPPIKLSPEKSEMMAKTLKIPDNLVEILDDKSKDIMRRWMDDCKAKTTNNASAPPQS
ncbi:MAG: hypothetical protein ACYCOU_18040 [Sulfobacillus sp.]